MHGPNAATYDRGTSDEPPLFRGGMSGCNHPVNDCHRRISGEAGNHDGEQDQNWVVRAFEHGAKISV
jgi:hypothetical protein